MAPNPLLRKFGWWLKISAYVTCLAILGLAITIAYSYQNGSLILWALLGFMVIGVIFVLLLTTAEYMAERGSLLMQKIDALPSSVKGLFFAIPFTTSIGLGALVYATPPIERAVVIFNGETTSFSKNVFYITRPFVDYLTIINRHHHFSISVTGVTQDKVSVRCDLRASVNLVGNNESAWLQLAQIFGSTEEINEALREEFERNFAQAAAETTLKDFNTLVAEYNTGKRVDRKFLADHDIKWTGTIVISNPHVYFPENTGS